MRMSKKLVPSNALNCVFRVGLARNSTVCVRKIVEVSTNEKKNIIPRFIHRHLATKSVFESLSNEKLRNEENQEERQASAQYTGGSRQEMSLEFRIESIDLQMKRTGRLDVGQLYAAIANGNKIGSLTEQQALVLIRGCGAVLCKEMAESRQKIFADVLKSLQNLVPKFDISHHNAILRTRLENKEKIEPAEVLANLEGNLNLFPNRITYQLLIAAYCENGDLAGASNILEHMKSQEIPINEAVFHSLVKGHMKQGDIEGANGMLSSMKTSGLLPIADTYTALMCGYAEHGNLEQIMQTLTEADSEEVSFQSRHLFEVILALVENGHGTSFSQFKQEVATRFANRRPYNHESMNCAFRLVTSGCDQEAMEVLQTINMEAIPDQGYKESIARQMLETYVRCNRNVEQIQAAIEELKTSGFLEDSPLSSIASMAVKMRNIDIALDVYRIMQSQGEEVRRFDLNALLSIRRQSRDLEAMCDFAVRAQSVLPQEKNFCYSLMGEVVEPLVRDGHSSEDILTKLQEKGMPDAVVDDLKTLDHLGSGRFSEAKNQITAKNVPGLSAMSLYLSRGYVATKDLNGLLEFLAGLRACIISEPYFKDLSTSTLSRILGRGSTEAEEAQNLIKAFMERELILFKGSSQEDILKHLRTKSMEDDKIMEIEESFQNLSIPEKSTQAFSPEQLKNLELMLEVNPETVPLQLRNRGEMRLLREYCRDGNVEKADMLLSRMEERGFRFPPDLLNVIGTYLAVYKHDLESALRYKEEILKLQKPVRARLTLGIACSYAAQGNVEKAVEEVSTAESPTVNFRYQLVDDAEKLLRLCSQKADAATVKSLLQTLFDKGFVQDGSYSLLIQVMKAYINSDEPDDIVSCLKEMVNKYGKVVYYNNVLEYFIQREDAERLQSVVDLGALVLGEMEVLHHLIFSFVDCDKLRQAQKIVETPGLRANMAILNKGMEQYLLRNKTEEMKHLKDITKDLFGINRDEMLFWLIRLYSRRKEPKLALDVLTCYEEEGVVPRPRTLRYLANVLRSFEMDVPFEVPKIPEKSENELAAQQTDVAEDTQVPSTEQSILRQLSEGLVQEALDLRQKALSDGENVRADLFASGVQSLSKNKQGNVTRDLIIALGDRGDVESLLHVRPKVPNMMSNFLHKALFKAYLNSGRIEELLTHLSQDVLALRRYIDVLNIEQLEKDRPDLFPKLVDLVMRYQDESQIYSVVNNLYSFYLLTDKYDAAQELLQKYPDIKSTIFVRGLLFEIAKREKESLFPVVADLVKEASRDNFVYSRWLEYRSDRQDLEGSRKVFEDARSRGIDLEKLSVIALEKYQGLLESNSQQVPWEPAALEKIKIDLEEKRKSFRGQRNANSTETTQMADE